MHLASFDELNAGQFVKITGQFREGAGFLAVEVTLESGDGDGEIESLIQGIDRRRKALRVCDLEIFIPDGIEMKAEDGEAADSMALQSGDMIKLKGVFSEAGFAPRKIKSRPAREFNFEQLQGKITHLDRERQTMLVNGITVFVTAKTVIEHGDGLDELREVAVPYIQI